MKPKQRGESITATTTWVRHDPYVYTEETSRWTLLRWLLRGSFKLKWMVPANKKDKRLHLEGKPL